jgi:hypothetical protein
MANWQPLYYMDIFMAVIHVLCCGRVRATTRDYPLLIHYVTLSLTFASLIICFFATSTIRRQFEQANLEAMDESAEWRMQYDKEVEKNRHLHDELSKVLLTYQILVHGYAPQTLHPRRSFENSLHRLRPH